ncbi:MAG: carbohydrate kinase [Woeseiaceae bacterium]|nr:carbohydrate kinase [Woeseiaceae bacterium]
MKRVVCFGEALIDFLNTGQTQEGDLALNTFTQFPGGAPANAAVAAAKLGGNAAFAGQVGGDPFGQFLVDSLERYGVDTSLTLVHPEAPTALAFVFLDKSGERSFAFRRYQTADVVVEKEQVDAAWYADEPIFHFCSNTLTDGSIADVTRYAVAEARRHGALVSFDVNLRHNLWQAGRADAELVNELVHCADVVKFSREEIDYLSEGDLQTYLGNCFAGGLTAALITDGAGDMSIHTAASNATVSPPAVDVVDTTGGGDAFIGAVLYGLSQQPDPLDFLADVAQLQRLVASAAHCGAWAVARRGAFPAFPTFADVENTWDV